MPLEAPGKPKFDSCTETAVTVKWDAKEEVAYRLYFKEFLKEWSEADCIEVGKGEGMATREVEGLAPCSTYSFRLKAFDPDTGETSDFGPQTDIDTQAADCTPKTGGKKCIIH